jgi:D-alanine--poly(phosphoribitol) ligase subunit 1
MNRETKVKFPENKTIHQLFEEQVNKTPNHTAALGPGQPLTYRQLNRKANSLARCLRKKGIGPETTAAIMVERSIAMIIGIFGILKAGGAYLPISPSTPPGRLNYLLKDTKTRVLLTQGKFLPLKEQVQPGVEIINIDMENEAVHREPGENLPIINTPGDLAYVIFTSGSTGKPKGVMIQHRSLVNRLNWMQRKYPLSDKDTILQKTPFFFDVSVWEMFWWSMVGAKVCFLKPNVEKFPQFLVEAIEKNHITVMHFVPSMFSVFLEYIKNSEEDIKRLSSLKQIFASGESLAPSHVQVFNDTLHSKNSTRLTNLYGPTEATVDVSFYDCPTSGEFTKIPIGKPIDNIQLSVLDSNHQLQPDGEMGELCISGVGVARGYLNRPELTAEKFLPLNRSDKSYTSYSSKKLYKTGDLARIMPDGNIEFLGRQDHQVKIHGLRIELGEIESLLSKHPSIRDTVIMVKQYSKNITMIIAYVISTTELPVKELKDYLKTMLPDYMIPNQFVFMESFPLTPSGKVDRKALPEPAFG